MKNNKKSALRVKLIWDINKKVYLTNSRGRILDIDIENVTIINDTIPIKSTVFGRIDDIITNNKIRFTGYINQ